MISFDLRCGNDHVFEAWFANSSAFESQREAGEIACPVCGDHDVAKALMAPNVSTVAAGNTDRAEADDVGETKQPEAPSVPAANATNERAAELMEIAKALRAEVEKSFDYVGGEFAEEAKKIHYGEADHRNIYGEMTPDEAVDLKEEGVEFGVLPWPSKGDA